MITAINPTTGEKIADYDLHSSREVDAALSDAAKAQSEWRNSEPAKRSQLLRSIASVLRADAARYAGLITEEMGKPITEAQAEIEKCAVTLDYYAENAARFLDFEEIPSNAIRSGVVYDPLGVVLAIMPWNYPFWQFFRFLAPALAAGNGAILKHANNVPACALEVEKIVNAAGAPAGLVKTLLIEASDVAAIIADDRIAAVTLTGSTEVGQIVAAQAGAALKKQVLELGGSDPFIVLADADVQEAAKIAVKARFTNAGQSCVNAKRFIIEDAVADEFVAAFTSNVQALTVGDPRSPETQIGPMARGNLRSDLHSQVQRTLEAGATLLTGGRPGEGDGYYYEPTVIDNVTADQAAFTEETFGPVAAIIRVSGPAEAIELANQTEFGLGAALWTTDLARADKLVRAIDAGAVFVNGMVASDARLPFGGIKKSGYGRELGPQGLREFVNVKTVWYGPTTAPTGAVNDTTGE
ncbi:NAD-dependent succinate-semialdehyde dehydrogenase [Pseudarthrobacter sp. NIBRBAC000502770]|uniref:NAD-dependent succinate-semialdehyde dehydrogenase n=1 Tax=Pseudarthrobacter sp. NIBRBAC000502770 TaxID=2590785 RepID=UPI00114005C1|nr:NAD-dependent succinate-semialdehyde dehydrogenase [Pseudarthrobacter sp. NIBRBAC000502770]QDG88176.1 NAD-dependent succinate-semialdehyde dehydrogenase [Pseudarthrobacter sp. NIBRBAC000502770]